jgi:hypothetical protein
MTIASILCFPRLAAFCACVMIACLAPSAAFAMDDQSETCEPLDKDFSRNIEKIAAATPHIDIPITLYYSRAFVAIWLNAERFGKEAETFLENANASEDQKMVVVYAMQRLRLPQLLNFYEKVFALRRTGKVSQEVFERTLFNTWNSQLIERYRNPRVVRFLRDVQDSRLLPNWSAYIDKILSGVARLRLRDDISEGIVGEDGSGLSVVELRRRLKPRGVYLGLICGDLAHDSH